MGAGNVIPVVPTFTAGSPTIAQLNALSYAVSFITDMDVRPAWHLFKTATLAVTANTWTTVTYDHTAYDCDGVQAYPGVKIVTQGYYTLEACVQIEATANKDDAVAAFFFTAGANNPHFTPGNTVYFGFKGCATPTTGAAAADSAICITDISPMVLYPLDVLDVRVYLDANHTLDYNQNTSYIQGRFASNFTGRHCRTGT